MFGLSSGSAIIDFCIGMMFFFLILTLTCTMINEYLMDKLAKVRQKTLLKGIAGLFYDTNKMEDFYKHPLITGLYDDEEKIGWLKRRLSTLTKWIKVTLAKFRKTNNKQQGGSGKEDSIKDCLNHIKSLNIARRLPTYIPSRTFANVLLDLVIKDAKNKITTSPTGTNIPKDPLNSLPELRRTVEAIDHVRIKGALLPLIDAAPNLEKAKESIEKWFDDTMDRVSGWFKRRARTWLLVVAAFVCVGLNADSIMVGKMLWQNDALRAAVVKQAEKIITKTPTAEAGEGAPPAPKSKKPQKKPKAVDKKSSCAAKPPKNPSAPATPDEVKQKTETPKTKEDDIALRVQAEINKLQFPLGWVCPKEDNWEKMECKWLKPIIGYFCSYPSNQKQGTPPKQETLAVDQSAKDQKKKKDNGKDKDEDKGKGKDKEKITIPDPRTVPTDSGDIRLKIMGLFFTTLAISFGAPFWTDLLNKFVNLRRGGNVPPKAGEEKK